MVTVVRAIETIPVKKILSLLAASIKNKPGFRVGLRCFSCQEYVSCGQQQARTIQVTNTRTILLVCLQELHKQIVDGNSAHYIDATRAADEAATSSSSTVDVTPSLQVQQSQRIWWCCSAMPRLALWPPPARSRSRPSRQRTLWWNRFRTGSDQ